MQYLITIVAATSISLAIIPLMVRLAPALGMMDQPSERKVHQIPIPRVGGWGIVLGALVPVIVLLPGDRIFHAYILGALILAIFGTWDDRKEIGHYVKFIGQFVAIVPLVIYGDLYVTSLPFLGPDTLPKSVAIPFTVISMMGVINALNHSDGLDGLAAGESLLCLSAITFLSFQSGAFFATIIAAATIGGALGFLRYNTHPAAVFMGDGGSQFLGYTLGFLVVLLTQKVDVTLSPAMVLLLVGLPIIDILVVLKKRILQGKNWFRASKNHVHHRLLELGFVHQESVVIIYTVQTLFVLAAVVLRYENDWMILAVYGLVCAILFVPLNIAEKTGWKIYQATDQGVFDQALSYARCQFLVIFPRRFLDIVIPGYLIIGSIIAIDVPRDFGLAAAVVFVLLLIEPFFNKTTRSIVRRALIYLVAAFIIYLHFDYPQLIYSWIGPVRISVFSMIAVSVAVAVRFSPRRRKFEFETTAMDFLMVFMVFAALGYSTFQHHEKWIGIFVIKLVVVLYACELSIIERRERWTPLTIASLVAVAILSFRGLVLG
ncbi:MAG: undecaprenyl/decaprenyl-phosphate alpha-N-acetylglucosaminyl 1-phosphate transferase [Gammaproteobacteria bacterium]|nr:undecaprenyl/decaprenyl-phosphate alpha-N-acetylglucosaminyl 1-phosphate transferase [Gammaproteobacteria bacterium]